VLGAGVEVHTLGLATSERYWDEREGEGAGPHTIKKELGMLRTALRHAKKHDRYVGDPSRVMPEGLANAYQPGERVLSVAEYRALRQALPAKRRGHLDAYVALGVSASVLYKITAAHVNLKESVVHVPGTKTAFRKRLVPIRAELHETLSVLVEEVKPGDPLFEPWGNARRDLSQACERAGIASVSPNDLRRTFATWLAEAGVPELVVAALMGHANSGMLRQVYARIGTDTQRAAIAKLPPIGAGPLADAGTVTLSVTDTAPNRGQNGRPGQSAADPRNDETPCFQGVSEVPRGGIEPSTRGFSIHSSPVSIPT
jgi:integrase